MSSSRAASSPDRSRRRIPSVWQGIGWALRRGGEGGGISRAELFGRALVATLAHGKALGRWMAIVHELKARGMLDDLEGEYLRAIRPSVQRHASIGERVTQLIDHTDWIETAFKPAALERLTSGKPVVLAELRPPRGFDYLRLQVQRTGVQSPEGELLLTLTAQRSSDVQHKALPLDLAALAFSRFRIEDTSCLVIGGVRGQRHHASRMAMSPVEVSQALQGWKPSVLLVCTMQELARAWGHKLVGLNPASHRLQGWSFRFDTASREAAERIFASHDALWAHFDAAPGPLGWVVLPLHSDDKLAATALSPEKRERQVRRADFWLRMRKALHLRMREVLVRPGREDQKSRVTQLATDHAPLEDDWGDLFTEDEEAEKERLQARMLQTGPLTLE
ncbi:MAG TPA: DUF535 family protein [Ramlibacter sp.]|uniref:DUF535 family protein n=1 Tax=Ramlibacter sp. TaxID=1917967 RepID=UPI002C8090F7|nr:DUF535 family protein [Ramlibacter sp.]HVZ43786.1 DUF535 family protein [Ramlibacter sp.]